MLVMILAHVHYKILSTLVGYLRGIWSGNYITNQTNGTFDPALVSGPTMKRKINGRQDTINVNVINTEILIGNYDICQNEGIQKSK